jgi:hypothetical protein
MINWSRFLSTKDPTYIGLKSSTPFHEEFIDLSEPPESLDSISLLDSFILLYKLKIWMEAEFHE